MKASGAPDKRSGTVSATAPSNGSTQPVTSSPEKFCKGGGGGRFFCAGGPTGGAPPPVVGSQKAVDRAQAVMAGTAAAELHPEFARAQIDLVMYDDDLRRQDLEKPCSFADGLAG